MNNILFLLQPIFLRRFDSSQMLRVLAFDRSVHVCLQPQCIILHNNLGLRRQVLANPNHEITWTIHPLLDISIIRSLVIQKRARSHSREAIIVRRDSNRHAFARLTKTSPSWISIRKELSSDGRHTVRKVLSTRFLVICQC